MRTHLLATFVLAVASLSWADAEGFRFDCRFTAAGAKGMEQCEVKARVCEFQRQSNDLLEADVCRDALSIACNGQNVFRNYATHFSRHDFEYIRGESEGQAHLSPILKYERSSPTQDHFTISAWLLVEDRRLQGFCSVRAP